MRAALFWTLFLPLGRCYSVDNLYSDKQWKERQKEARPYHQGSEAGGRQTGLMGRLWVGTKNFFWEGLQTPTTDSPQGKKFNVFNAAAIATVLQLGFMYYFSVYHKTGDSWWVTGDAVQLALGLDFFRMAPGDFLLWWDREVLPGTLFLLGRGTLYWEFIGGFSFFFPIFSAPCRILGALGYIFMHLGFALW